MRVFAPGATNVLGLVSLLASGGCGHTKAPGVVLPPDGSAPVVAVPDGGGIVPASTETLIITMGSGDRIVVVHAPARPGGPVPLVLNLHGSGGTAVDEEAFIGMDQAADAHGFIVAYPQGAIALGSGFAWNVPGQPLSGGGAVPPDAQDDVAFIAQAIASIKQKYAVDPKRIYATGLSGGGRMASQLGCDLAMTLAAVAPVAGLRFPVPCGGQRALPVVTFHGTADTTNPYDGGGPAYWTTSVPAAARDWASHDGCAATPTVSQPAAGVELTTYTGCAGGASVDLYTIAGGGHEWPGAPQQANAIDACAVMWNFFSMHPLP